MAINDPLSNDPLAGDPVVEYAGETYVNAGTVPEYEYDDSETTGWKRWRWLLVPFMLGLSLLGWGIQRLRQAPAPTTAEIAVAQCQYQMGNLSLSSTDEDQVFALVTGSFPAAAGHHDQILTAAKKLCLAHLCSANDARLQDLPNIAAEEFAFAVTPGNLLTGDVASSFVNEFTGAAWCHG